MTNAWTLKYAVFNVCHVSFKILAAVVFPPFYVDHRLQEHVTSVVDSLCITLFLNSVGTQILESVRSNPLFYGNGKRKAWLNMG